MQSSGRFPDDATSWIQNQIYEYLPRVRLVTNPAIGKADFQSTGDRFTLVHGHIRARTHTTAESVQSRASPAVYTARSATWRAEPLGSNMADLLDVHLVPNKQQAKHEG